MSRFKNTPDHYGSVAIMLHWTIGLLIIAQIFLGWYMNTLEHGDPRLQLIGVHKQVGVLILVLATARLLWRSTNLSPSMDDLALWERIASRAVHYLLYFFMFALPITGWMMTSAKGYTLSFFGLFTLPDLMAPNKALGHQLSDIHTWLAYILLGFIVLHILAAVKHYCIDHDNVVKRMFF